jgi:hypothetical protein
MIRVRDCVGNKTRKAGDPPTGHFQETDSENSSRSFEVSGGKQWDWKGYFLENDFVSIWEFS